MNSRLHEIGNVTEWAEVMGYEDPKLFLVHFFKHFDELPRKVFTRIRLESIIRQLREDNLSKTEIARAHKMRIGNQLYDYVYYHLKSSTGNVKSMPNKELKRLMEKFRRKNP